MCVERGIEMSGTKPGGVKEFLRMPWNSFLVASIY